MPAYTALITGGTSGIGKATAELLHSRGYRVMVTGLGNVADTGLPEDVTVVRADARSLPDIDQAMDQARRQLGSLDLLFLNAGISRPGPIESTDEDAFDALFESTSRAPSSPCKRRSRSSTRAPRSCSPWAPAKGSGPR